MGTPGSAPQLPAVEPTAHEVRERCRRVALACSAGAALLGVCGLLGYLPGLGLLGAIRPHYIPMAPATALCFLTTGFVVGGVAKEKWQSGFRLAAPALMAAAVAAFGLLRVVRYLTGSSASLENALLPDLVLSVFRDATERKLHEAVREHLIRELERQNAELERFTYTVSHDLKAPLITIRGFAGALEEDIADGDVDGVAADVAHISQAAAKMQHLLDDLLELSRLGQMVGPPEAVSLTELVQEAVELVSGRISAGGVRLEIATDLPTVPGDRARLLEVFENLLDNAAKFMGGQPEPRIEVGVRQQGGESVLYVRDNGIGIEPRHQGRVFGLFDKLEKTAEGTGVGLAIVKRLIELHNGRIWIESDGKGGGSAFCFTLPGVTALEPD